MALIEPNWSPSRRDLRVFAGVVLPAFGALLGGALYLGADAPRAAAAVAGGAAALACAGLASPSIARIVYGVWMSAVYPIGWTISHLLLGGIYYGLITPLGWLARLVRGDRLERRADPQATSYWSDYAPHDDLDGYFKQF
ncbi:MAG: SxtJ family membrane protein [Myxococcota bacterium]|nr:SxtJ family membrane protein [Myxococcota bacterium]